MPYGDAVGFGDMGWTGIPAVMTTAAGTGAGNAMGGNATGSVPSQVSGMSCTLCSNPQVQEGLFILAIILIAIGWHLHVFSLIEEM